MRPWAMRRPGSWSPEAGWAPRLPKWPRTAWTAGDSLARTHPTRKGAAVRHTEFWSRMEAALGRAYARSWADQQVIAALGGRTVTEALDDGVRPKVVWAAVSAVLELPVSLR